MVKTKSKELGLSCMLNTEVGAVLAVIRRPVDPNAFISPQEDLSDSSLQRSLKSLRSFIFNPHSDWRTIDPSIYLSPFLDVIRSDGIPAAATRVALSAILKILKLGIFDEKTPGAKEAVNIVVTRITSCRLEQTDPVSEEAVMMKILQVLTATMRHNALILLSDQAVCTIVNTCFQVVQQSVTRGDLLQRTAKHTMHELIQIIFSRLYDVDFAEEESSDESSGYGVCCAVDIFQFLCSLLNVGEGPACNTADEDVQLFALVLINCAIELSGDEIGKHPKLLRMVQDDLFHHLIHYGTCSSPLVLSMICSTVLNIYHFLRSRRHHQLAMFVIFKIQTPARHLRRSISGDRRGQPSPAVAPSTSPAVGPSTSHRCRISHKLVDLSPDFA